MSLTRKDKTDMVAWALKRAPLRRKIEGLDVDIAADKIVEYLEMCGVEWSQRPAQPWHSATPFMDES